MSLQTMDLNTIAVVDEHIFLLGHGEKGLILQKPRSEYEKVNWLQKKSTYVISRHVSCNCNSEWIVPVCQSNVETCPVRPTIARCLEKL
jgi:hypothetical protein